MQKPNAITIYSPGYAVWSVRINHWQTYGEFALYRPPFSAKTVLLWLAPGIALIAGLFMVARIAASSVRQSDDTPVDAEKLAAAQALLLEREQQRDSGNQSG